MIITLAMVTIDSVNLSAQDGPTYMRIAKITVDSTKLDEYKTALNEQMQSAIRLEKGVLSYSAAQGQEQSFKDYNPGNIPKCRRISGAHSNRAFQKIQGNGRCHGKGIGINRCCSNCYTIKTKITRLTNKKRESPVAHKMFSVMVPCRVG